MLRKLTIMITATAAMAILLLASSAYAVTLYPTEDTYTPDDIGGSSHGGETQLLCANSSGCSGNNYDRSMVLFDLSSYMGQTVTTATFNIYQFYGGCGVCNADFFHATESWDESYSGGHISHNSTAWANKVFSTSTGWFDVDVTDLLQAWLDGDMPNYGFVMHARNGSKYGKFYSNDNASNKPYLELGTTGIESKSLGAIKAAFK